MARIIKDLEQRRQEILAAALALFCEKGYEKTSIGDIAQRLGVSQGLCYRYFSSKEELLDCAMDQYAHRQVEQMLPHLHDQQRSLAELIREMPTFLDLEDPADPAYQLSHSKGGQRLHSQLSHRICELLTPAVQERLEYAVHQGEIVLDDPETTAAFLVFGQEGVLSRWDLPGAKRVERIRAFLCRFLGLDPTSPQHASICPDEQD